jgi:hypothetical protein
MAGLCSLGFEHTGARAAARDADARFPTNTSAPPAVRKQTANGQRARSTPALASKAAHGIEFKGARLGMTIGEWKALAYPGRAPPRLTKACSNDAQRLADSGLSVDAPEPSADLVVCTYITRYGSKVLPQSFPLTKAYFVRDPKYYFLNGRLTKVEFRTSVDAFDDVMATLKKSYGPATQTERDDFKSRVGLDLPRVQIVWRLSNGFVEITDPSSPPNQLEVEIATR